MRQQIQNILDDYSKQLQKVLFVGDTMQIVIADEFKNIVPIPVQLDVDLEGYAILPSEQEVEVAIDCFFVRDQREPRGLFIDESEKHLWPWCDLGEDENRECAEDYV